MSNYPPGSEDDPNAPWNKEEKTKECDFCKGAGIITTDDGDEDECEECDGSGERVIGED